MPSIVLLPDGGSVGWSRARPARHRSRQSRRQTAPRPPSSPGSGLPRLGSLAEREGPDQVLLQVSGQTRGPASSNEARSGSARNGSARRIRKGGPQHAGHVRAGTAGRPAARRAPLAGVEVIGLDRRAGRRGGHGFGRARTGVAVYGFGGGTLASRSSTSAARSSGSSRERRRGGGGVRPRHGAVGRRPVLAQRPRSSRQRAFEWQRLLMARRPRSTLSAPGAGDRITGGALARRRLRLPSTASGSGALPRPRRPLGSRSESRPPAIRGISIRSCCGRRHASISCARGRVLRRGSRPTDLAIAHGAA